MNQTRTTGPSFAATWSATGSNRCRASSIVPLVLDIAFFRIEQALVARRSASHVCRGDILFIGQRSASQIGSQLRSDERLSNRAIAHRSTEEIAHNGLEASDPPFQVGGLAGAQSCPRTDWGTL